MEVRSLSYNGRRIDYTVRRHSRAKRIRITVEDNGLCSVTVPRRIDGWRARRFVRQKADWILRQKQECRRLRRIPNIPRSAASFELAKEKTRRLIERRIAHFSSYHRFYYNRISIKAHKRQWGSCSHKKNLNFNYKLLFLPPRLADYVIIHELCHLEELNHSDRFWRLVEKLCPNYAKRDAELAQYRVGA